MFTTCFPEVVQQRQLLLSVMEYCVGGPQITPHIVAQQQLAPGETRAIELVLELGAHRVRARSNQVKAVPGHIDVRVSAGPEDGPLKTGHVTATDHGWLSDQATLASSATIVLENRTAFPQAIVIERHAWNDQAATATDLSTLQRFRDWFAAQTLRPDVRLGIANLAILFTDLRGSTQLYRAIKTIGDSIMAVFADPAAGVKAALDILRRMAAFNQVPADFPLRVKLGLHTGPAMAVTLNDRLDYFGTTVNIASRLEGQAQGDDLIVSRALWTRSLSCTVSASDKGSDASGARRRQDYAEA